MKSFKKGFTLAEVLITLAIAGVVAAVAIPQLVKNHQKSQAGLTLARTVAQIETGCANYLEAKSAEKKIRYTQLSMIDGISTMELARYIGLKPAKEEYKLNNYKDFSIAASFLLPAAYAAIMDDSTIDIVLPDVPMCYCLNGAMGHGYPPVNGQCIYENLCSGKDPNTWNGDVEPDLGTGIEFDPDLICKNFPCSDFCTNETLKASCKEDDVDTDLCDKTPCAEGCPLADTITCKKPEQPLKPNPNPKPAVKNYSYTSKGKADIIFESDIDTSKTLATATVASFVIDTNGGGKSPNMYGKDAFKFALRNDGKVIPVGEKAKQVVADGYKIKY